MHSVKSKPLASLFILFYKQKSFVKDAINGALSQDYENLEIVLSDDCSPDGTFEEIKRCVSDYKGPHKIILNRNPKNLGIAQHVNKVVYELCHGEFLVAAGGDDVSLQQRVSISVEFLMQHPGMQSMTFMSKQVDAELNELKGNDGPVATDSYSVFTMDDYCNFKDFIIFSGDSRTFRRSLIDTFPPLTDAPEEDLEFFVRSFLLGQVGYVRKQLVLRRIHNCNVSKKRMPRSIREAQYSQLAKDVEFAYQKDIINVYQYSRMNIKIKEIKDFFFDIDDLRAGKKISVAVRRISRLLKRFIK